MKRLFPTALAVLALSGGVRVSAQMVYTGAGPAPPGGYSFGKSESMFSINNSYLGYSNFTYYGPHAPAVGYSLPPKAPAPRYVAAPARAVAPRRVFQYRGRWYYQN
jgi:hypothetical protein